METYDQRVGRAMAVLSAIEMAVETDTPVEVAGVKAYPCDGHGRVHPAAAVERRPVLDTEDDALFDAADLPRVEPNESDAAAHWVEGRGLFGPRTLRTTTSETPFGTARVTTEHRTRLYVAGTISGDARPLEEKKAEFYEGAAALRGRGYDTVNPLDVGNDLCLHETCYENTVRRMRGKDQGAGHSWECYLRHDMIELLRCDGVALLPGWHLSPGARAEFDLANTVGLPCRPIEEWLALADVRQIDFNEVATSPVYCARCGATLGSHVPGGTRFGCAFAGKGTVDECGQCGRPIIWSGQRWEDDGLDDSRQHLCRASARPDAAHEPVGAGEQR